MASFNKIIIVGHLGRDPELRHTPAGTAVCDFSVATTERKGKDRSDEVTTWFRVTMWGRQAEVAAEYLAKGKPVYVEGRLTEREWVDREGIKRVTLEVHGTDLQFLAARGDDAGANGSARPHVDPASGDADTIVDDDIPF